MMLDTIVGIIGDLNDPYGEDIVDRWHYLITSNLLLAFGMLISYRTFGKRPIECAFDGVNPEAFQSYAENYCWAKDTYFLPFTDIVPGDPSMRDKQRISYYQWVPFFLLFEAACFRLPSLAWKYLAGHSGIKVHDIVKCATDPRTVDVDGRKQTLGSLTIHLQNALRFHRRVHKKNVRPHTYLVPLNLPYTASFVTFVYLFVKTLYLANVVLQLYLMNQFLGTDHYSMFGFGLLTDLFDGATWEQSGIFPRVTLCDFQVRVMGSNVQRYSVQCVLVINIFNEKIFIFLWFWYIILGTLTAISIIYWSFVMVVPCFSRWFVSRHLELSEMPFDPKGSRKDVERFVVGYLKTDGVFILRMITMHAGIIFGTDLILNLWKTFYGIEEYQKRKLTGSPSQLVPLQFPMPALHARENDGETCPCFRLRRRKKVHSDAASRDSATPKKSDKRLQEVLIPNDQGKLTRAFILKQSDKDGTDDDEDESGTQDHENLIKEEDDQDNSLTLRNSPDPILLHCDSAPAASGDDPTLPISTIQAARMGRQMSSPLHDARRRGGDGSQLLTLEVDV